VSLVDDEHDGAVPFGGLGGEQVGGLGHQRLRSVCAGSQSGSQIFFRTSMFE
jgi:hypothetical protein